MLKKGKGKESKGRLEMEFGRKETSSGTFLGIPRENRWQEIQACFPLKDSGHSGVWGPVRLGFSGKPSSRGGL
jgi:hypothetical protein